MASVPIVATRGSDGLVDASTPRRFRRFHIVAFTQGEFATLAEKALDALLANQDLLPQNSSETQREVDRPVNFCTLERCLKQ